MHIDWRLYYCDLKSIFFWLNVSTKKYPVLQVRLIYLTFLIFYLSLDFVSSTQTWAGFMTINVFSLFLREIKKVYIWLDFS